MKDVEDDDGPLTGFRAEEDPPAGLEDRLVARLRADGRLVARRPRWPASAVAAALALLCVTGGWLLGRRSVPPPASADARPLYLLLLYEDAAFPMEPALEAQRVEEYSRWAGRLAASGSLVSAEKLKDDATTLLASAPERQETLTSSAPGGRLAGFFVVRAASDGEARQIARECPHLGHGGRVVVRPIEDTSHG